MQKQKKIQYAKTLLMLLGFPLMSFVLLLTSIQFMQEDFMGDFARNWLIVTVVIWLAIEMLRYFVVRKIKNKKQITRLIINVSLLTAAVLAIILPTTIYGAVIGEEYGKFRQTMLTEGISLDDFDYITGWTRGLSDSGRNSFTTLKAKIDNFKKDYGVDNFYTVYLGNNEDKKYGYGTYPGVEDTIVSKLKKKADAADRLEALKKELEIAKQENNQEKIDELTKPALSLDLSIASLDVTALREELAAINNITPEVRKALYGDIPMPEGTVFPSYTEAFSNINGLLKIVFGNRADIVELGNIDLIIKFLGEQLGISFVKDMNTEDALSYAMEVVYGLITEGNLIDNLLTAITGKPVSGMGGTIESLLSPQLKYTDNKLVVITTLINELYDPQSELAKQLVPLLGLLGIKLPETVELNQTIKVPVGNSVIQNAEEDATGGWSSERLRTLQAEITHNPKIIAYGNFMYIAYIFSGVVALTMMLRIALEEKEIEAVKEDKENE